MCFSVASEAVDGAQRSLPQREPPSQPQPLFQGQSHLLGLQQVTVDPDLVQAPVYVGVTAGRQRETEGRTREQPPDLLHVSAVASVDDPFDPLSGLEPQLGHGLLEPPGPGLDSGLGPALVSSSAFGQKSV